MPATTTTGHTGNSYIDGLLYGGKWATTSLTFSFPTSASFYGSTYGSGEPGSNFEAFNATQQAAVRATLAMYSAVGNVTFTEVTETSSTHGDLRYAMSDLPGTAWAYMPSSLQEGGDAWFGNSNGWYDNPVLGNYAFASIIHETGHALGLKHPHEVSGTFAAMPVDHDSLEYSVMSYRSFVGASTSTGYTNGSSSYPQSLMMYDVAAIQSMYGANYSTNSGNTVYSWSPTSGQTFVNGVAQGTVAGNKIFLTIWDGGGTDTYDFSLYTTSVTVDLRPGNWSTASTTQLAALGSGHNAAGNIANALLYNNNTASLIENAIGGSGADTIIGNAADNALRGGAGNDSIDGQGGTNTAVYSGTHLDYLQVQNTVTGTWTITDLRALSGGDGIDTLANIQYIQFSDGVYAIGGISVSVNHTPVANADSYSVSANTTLTVAAGAGVLANDTDSDGNPLTATLMSGSANGTVNLAANGGFTFTPTAGWSGTTSFTYRANDGQANSGTQTVTITVAPPPAVNHAPVATADSYSTKYNTPITVAANAGVLANDTDSDGNPLTAQLVSGPSNGTVKLNADGSFTFTPKASWSGTASFTYKASDGTTTSATQTATIVVAPNHAPVAVADSYSGKANTMLAVAANAGVLANDTDTDGNALTAKLVTGPSNGTLKLNADGSFSFTPKANWSGTTSFTYKTSDGITTSATQKATIVVAAGPVNHAPAAKADTYSTQMNTALTVTPNGVLSNDTDSDGNPITATLVSGPKNGTLSFNADGSFVFTPKAGWSGSTSFTYKAADVNMSSATTKVTINVTKTSATSHANGPDAVAAASDTIDYNSFFGPHGGTHGNNPWGHFAHLFDGSGQGHASPLAVDDMPAPAGWLPDLPDDLQHSHSEFALA